MDIIAQGQFSEGYARVVAYDELSATLKYGFIDQSKQLVIPLEYFLSTDWTQSRAFSTKQITDEFLSLTEYDFHNGKCLVFKGSQEGVIDKVNRIVVPFDNYRITLGNPFHIRDTYICSYEKGDVLVSRSGNITKLYESMHPITKDRLKMSNSPEELGILDWSGKEIVHPHLNKILNMDDKYFTYSLNGYTGIGNLMDGSVVLPSIYNSIEFKFFEILLELNDERFKLKITDLPNYSKKIRSHVEENEDFYMHQYGKVPSIDKV